MIARIQGRVESVSETAAIISVGDISYEVLTPAVDIPHLQRHIGQRISFVTLHYMEGNASFGQLTPRLIGFIRQQDKDFFEQFITVKGIGPRRALRALTQPVDRIAAAINQKDSRFLTSLPEIGKRTAEQVIAELSGKVDQFAGAAGGVAAPPARSDQQTAAIEAMISLGERAAEAENWVDRACRAAPSLADSASIMKAAYRLKAGGS
jgi:Holliday junction DNA helicase RuvA